MFFCFENSNNKHAKKITKRTVKLAGFCFHCMDFGGELASFHELHRLLGALLSKELTVDGKLDIVGTEYDISVEGKSADSHKD